MSKKRWVRIIAAVCLIASALVSGVKAQEQATSLQVGGTILEVVGKASPNAFITISRDGSVIGTTNADINGDFGRSFTAQEPGIHEISLFGHTLGGANTDTVTTSANFAEHATTTVNIFLPPTVIIEDTTLEPGQDLVLSGEATPSCTITVFIDNSNYAQTTSDNLGNWSIAINTDGLAAGEHSLFVRANNSFGEQSYPTAARSFTKAQSQIQPPDTPPTSPDVPGIFTPPTSPTSPVRPPNIPVITFPTPGTIWDKPTITVTGTADPNVQVELWDGESNLSSVFSDPQGNWSIDLDLVPKDYKLRARACNQGVCSDFTDIVPFTAMPGRGGLFVKLEQSSFMVFQGQPIDLLATISGGTPPYTTKVEWDDQTTSGSSSLQTEVQLSHAYTQPGQYTGRLTVTDADGLQNSLTFTVNVLPKPVMTNFALLALIVLLILIALFLLFMFMRRRRRKNDNRRPETRRQ